MRTSVGPSMRWSQTQTCAVLLCLACSQTIFDFHTVSLVFAKNMEQNKNTENIPFHWMERGNEKPNTKHQLFVLTPSRIQRDPHFFRAYHAYEMHSHLRVVVSRFCCLTQSDGIDEQACRFSGCPNPETILYFHIPFMYPS